jgi:hypothetical protein
MGGCYGMGREGKEGITKGHEEPFGTVTISWVYSYTHAKTQQTLHFTVW